jgi:hypothetical protein
MCAGFSHLAGSHLFHPEQRKVFQPARTAHGVSS